MSDKERIIKELFPDSEKLPTLPVLYVEINRVLDNPFSSIRKISCLLMKDQSMVAKILTLANSALYAKPQEITNLANAIIFLGTQTLKNLILQVAIVRMFPFDKKDLPGFNPGMFWEHSLGTAYFTNALVKKLKLPVSDDYYIGALLHDLGKLIIYQFYPGKFKDIIHKQIQENTPCEVAEEEVLGVNHADIGGFLAEKWNFNPVVVAAMRDHHKLLAEPNLHVALIQIADKLAKAAGLCFPWEKRVFNIMGDPAWDVVKAQAGSSGYIDGVADMDRLAFEILEKSETIKESVRELLRVKP
ncbi:MAG TPA: HDOD domain-containing protein [Candidatus Deferrimicrobium sp.]|nr:HDOD domain-containing protein [Candidatus Deferrimicrobium sp.]